MSRVRSAVATLDTATMAGGGFTSFAGGEIEQEARSSADVQPTDKSFRFGAILDSVTDSYSICNLIVMFVCDWIWRLVTTRGACGRTRSILLKTQGSTAAVGCLLAAHRSFAQAYNGNRRH